MLLVLQFDKQWMHISGRLSTILFLNWSRGISSILGSTEQWVDHLGGAKSLSRGLLFASSWGDLDLNLADDEVFLLLLEDAASSAIGTEAAGVELGAFFFHLGLDVGKQ